jgi:hypothetical protein
VEEAADDGQPVDYWEVVAWDYQRFSAPSPFHPLFEDEARYAEKSEIQYLCVFSGDGETRTRTGDTTIFRQMLQALDQPRKCLQTGWFGCAAREPKCRANSARM